ncbi:hypothetical protein RFI_14964 [Reticulomyxa filosa]|uniref:PH domain-containing protein n=1 Tax=Reticulomyxa filosa TaxID=46433 RepID=X6N8K4_RETFI|nr:hypothetical protein RFI_14964 [Reticulomyxa filosa]|eukprot:ETO22238.1 hypothetical protein RFI_14964 [Reticulomyxa filosa]
MTHQFQYSDAVHESVDNVPDEVEDISETSIGDSMTSDKEVFSPINKPTFIFEIQTLDRKVQFGCEDSSIMNEWIAAVQLLANYVREREFSEVDVTIAPTQLQKNKIKIDPFSFFFHKHVCVKFFYLYTLLNISLPNEAKEEKKTRCKKKKKKVHFPNSSDAQWPQLAHFTATNCNISFMHKCFTLKTKQTVVKNYHNFTMYKLCKKNFC